MSATVTPPPKAEPVAAPVLWTVEEFQRMTAAGVLRDQRCFLIDGVLLEQDEVPNPRKVLFTRDQYRQLGRFGILTDRRTELIYGVLYEMSPIGWPHVVAGYKTRDVLEEAFDAVGWVNVQYPYSADESDPQPDVAVIPGRIEDYADHPAVSLLIVEIADTTLTRDTTVKLELYASAAVGEYWVLDLTSRRLLVFRDPYPHPAGGHTYRTHLTLGPSDTVTPLAAPHASVKVADLLP